MLAIGDRVGIPEEINLTREAVFHWDIQTPKIELEIRCKVQCFLTKFNEGVWIGDEPLAGVFDISFQLKQKLKTNNACYL